MAYAAVLPAITFAVDNCERKTAQNFSLLPSLRVDWIIRNHQLMAVGKVFSVCYLLTSSAE